MEIMKAENEKEFLALIERYESITLAKLSKAWLGYGFHTLNKITGFGQTSDCTLCRTIRDESHLNCSLCVYGSSYGCVHNKNEVTYHEITQAPTPEELLIAIKNRAKHMKKVWKQYQKQI